MSYNSFKVSESSLKRRCAACDKPIREDGQENFMDPSSGTNCCECAEAGSVALKEKEPPTILREVVDPVPMPDFGERYKAVRLIGHGGMGRVFEAWDNELEKTFAIKVLKEELANDPQTLKRFEQEVMSSSKLSHPNLVPVYGHGQCSDGAPYMVMDFVDGEDLRSILENVGRLDHKRALDIFIQCCEALAHAHENGVIHRDIKPSNIIVTRTESGADVVRLLDFGIAKIHAGQIRETQDLTRTGDIFGSPAYMSPEQCLGLNVDARSDLYSLGCVIYEALLGKQIFAGDNAMQVVARHIAGDLNPIYDAVAAAAPAWEPIIMSTVTEQTQNRYQSVGDLLKHLRLLQSGQRVPFRHSRLLPERLPKKFFFSRILYSYVFMAMIFGVVPILALTFEIKVNYPLLGAWLLLSSMLGLLVLGIADVRRGQQTKPSFVVGIVTLLPIFVIGFILTLGSSLPAGVNLLSPANGVIFVAILNNLGFRIGLLIWLIVGMFLMVYCTLRSRPNRVK